MEHNIKPTEINQWVTYIYEWEVAEVLKTGIQPNMYSKQFIPAIPIFYDLQKRDLLCEYIMDFTTFDKVPEHLCELVHYKDLLRYICPVVFTYLKHPKRMQNHRYHFVSMITNNIAPSSLVINPRYPLVQLLDI